MNVTFRYELLYGLVMHLQTPMSWTSEKKNSKKIRRNDRQLRGCFGDRACNSCVSLHINLYDRYLPLSGGIPERDKNLFDFSSIPYENSAWLSFFSEHPACKGREPENVTQDYEKNWIRIGHYY